MICNTSDAFVTVQTPSPEKESQFLSALVQYSHPHRRSLDLTPETYAIQCSLDNHILDIVPGFHGYSQNNI